VSVLLRHWNVKSEGFVIKTVRRKVRRIKLLYAVRAVRRTLMCFLAKPREDITAHLHVLKNGDTYTPGKVLSGHAQSVVRKCILRKIR